MTTSTETSTTLLKNTNQALGIGQFAVDFMGGLGEPSKEVCDRTTLFFY